MIHQVYVIFLEKGGYLPAAMTEDFSKKVKDKRSKLQQIMKKMKKQ